MNLLWIVSDTLRADHLGCYGNDRVQTPNLDAFAAKSVLFEEHHAEGLPTGPERLVWMTGKFTLPFRGWTDIEPHEPTLAGVLRDAGYTTMMIADTAAIFKNNYHGDFDWHCWNHGQEHDPLWSGNRHDDVWNYLKPDHHDVPPQRKQRGEGALDSLTQYLRNTARRQSEEDYFAAKSCRLAMDWLDDNADCQPFFLWLDLFDPHEPWDPPEHYRRLYDSPDYDGPKLITPWFHSLFYEDFTEEEQRHFEALYAAEVTFVDHWVGQLLRKVEVMGLLDNTMIVFTSDHGTNLGERGHVTKCPKAGNTLCRGLAHVPLIVHHPGGPHNARVEQLSWSPDVTPTVLAQMGMDVPADMHGRDLWSVTVGDASAGRDYTITGWGGQKWYYVRSGNAALVREETEDRSELYLLDRDPTEGADVANDHPALVAALQGQLAGFFAAAEDLPR